MGLPLHLDLDFQGEGDFHIQVSDYNPSDDPESSHCALLVSDGEVYTSDGVIRVTFPHSSLATVREIAKLLAVAINGK